MFMHAPVRLCVHHLGEARDVDGAATRVLLEESVGTLADNTMTQEANVPQTNKKSQLVATSKWYPEVVEYVDARVSRLLEPVAVSEGGALERVRACM